MKITKKLFIAVAVVLSLGLTSASAWAGSKQQHRWEGVAIGVGAAIIGSALINYHATGYHSGPPVAFSFNYREYRRHPSRHHGYRKPHRGGHHNQWRHHNRGHQYKWRPHNRGHQYKGKRHHGDVHGHRHPGKWQSSDRGHHADRRSHNSGRGGRRY